MSITGDETGQPTRPTHLLNGKQEDPENVSQSPKKKFPASVFFIIGNEFCERFSYYGMRTVLTLYLTDQLNFSNDTATVIFHVFSCLCYFTPIFGAMLADSAIGKFNTILYVSILYAAGNIVLALAATPPLHFPMLEISMLGLAMIAVGTGGIKPCVSAYGGDQFDQDQAKQRQRFFSIFYFSINAGSLISTFLTPVLRANVKCFDGDSCFPLAFGVPAALMVVAVVLFACGKPLYRNVPQTGSVLIRVFGCVGHALRRRLFGGSRIKLQSTSNSTGIDGRSIKKNHWLEYADDKYDKKFIGETRAALRVMYLYLPLPLFWALYDQQGSRWTLQATQMNGALSSSYSIQPDQIQVVNAILILIFIPLFEAILYPFMAKCNVLVQPLRRIFWGGILAALAFLIAAAIEIKLEAGIRAVPTTGHFDISLVNTLPCDVNFTLNNNSNNIIQSHQAWSQFGVDLDGHRWHNVRIEIYDPQKCGVVSVDQLSTDFRLQFDEQNAYLAAIGLTDAKQVIIFQDKVLLTKSSKGIAGVRILYDLGDNLIGHNLTSFHFRLTGGGREYSFPVGNVSHGFTNYIEVHPTNYAVWLSGENQSMNAGSATVVQGGVYTILVTSSQSNSNETSAVVFVEMEPNTISMLWQLPQYVVITVAEILFSITGLEFSYSQSPLNMKSVLQAAWLMTTAVGDLIVVIVAEAHFFDKQYKEFFLFAGLMVIVMIIFALMAYSYEYVSADEWTNKDDEDGDGSKDHELTMAKMNGDHNDRNPVATSET